MQNCLCGCGLPLGFVCPCCKAPLDLRMLNPDDSLDWQPKTVSRDITCQLFHAHHAILKLKMLVAVGQHPEVNERGVPRDAQELGRVVMVWPRDEKRAWWDDVVRKIP